MASYAKGGISEWLDMDCVDFVDWMDDLKELNKQ